MNKIIDRGNKACTSSSQSKCDEWFDDMISNLRVDQLLMGAGTIDPGKNSVYKAMMEDDINAVNSYAQKKIYTYFVWNIINSYLSELCSTNIKPNKLALDLSYSNILVWAEINDDDEEAENALILSAAKINNKFSDHGFHISYTVVEKGDGFNVPSHYKELSLKQ